MENFDWTRFTKEITINANKENYEHFNEEMDILRSRLIKAERNKHINGEGNSFSWDEVKQMAMDKNR